MTVPPGLGLCRPMAGHVLNATVLAKSRQMALIWSWLSEFSVLLSPHALSTGERSRRSARRGGPGEVTSFISGSCGTGADER